jgi:hypothetical protein
MWIGVGIVSPAGMFLKGYATTSDFVLERLTEAPKGDRLVFVTARLETITKRQFLEMNNTNLGFILPEKTKTRCVDANKKNRPVGRLKNSK